MPRLWKSIRRTNRKELLKKIQWTHALLQEQQPLFQICTTFKWTYAYSQS
jgi:hypothetical protein